MRVEREAQRRSLLLLYVRHKCLLLPAAGPARASLSLAKVGPDGVQPSKPNYWSGPRLAGPAETSLPSLWSGTAPPPETAECWTRFSRSQSGGWQRALCIPMGLCVGSIMENKVPVFPQFGSEAFKAVPLRDGDLNREGDLGWQMTAVS